MWKYDVCCSTTTRNGGGEKQAVEGSIGKGGISIKWRGRRRTVEKRAS
jgi:hypothetical protein